MKVQRAQRISADLQRRIDDKSFAHGDVVIICANYVEDGGMRLIRLGVHPHWQSSWQRIITAHVRAEQVALLDVDWIVSVRLPTEYSLAEMAALGIQKTE
jgi:hypothetical protein